jgi:N-acetylglucosamine kinase-like BadF-type ATPase
MKYVLAVDGGGSKTHVICADETGAIIGEGVSGPTSLTATTVGAASFNLKEAVRQATETLPPETSFANLTIGLAGLDTPPEEVQARSVFTQVMSDRKIDHFILVNDTVIALENGTDDANALVVIAGTGSNCFGRNAQGMTAQAGGLDYILSDQGSGYNIGRAVLRKAVKSFDGRGPKTELEQFVCEHFHINSIAELKPKVHNPLLTKTEVAELAQQCLRAFDQGDQIAKGIFDHNIDELILMATAVLEKLELKETPSTCVLAGSITKIAYVQTQFSDHLKKAFPQVQVVVPTTPPVHGAVKLALKAL